VRQSTPAERGDKEANSWLDIGQTQRNLALRLAVERRMPEAEAQFRKALKTHEQVLAEHSDFVWAQRKLADAHGELGAFYRQIGRRDEAMTECREAIRLH
jgi:hypothetical protein